MTTVRTISKTKIRRRSRGVIVGGILFIAIGAGTLMQSYGLVAINFSYFWPLFLIALGISELLGRAQRVEIERVRSTRLATAEERVKIAQELHDIVAHSVSLMTVQIGAARKVFEKKPDDAMKALQAAEETGRQSLGELRNMLSILRSADRSIEEANLQDDSEGLVAPAARFEAETRPLPGLGDLASLVDATKIAGLNVTIEEQGTKPAVSPSIELTVYRVVQEALTNALRYAPNAKVEVLIRYSSDEIALKVIDDGPGVFGTPVKTGHGLLGMSERISAVRGTLDAGPDRNGRGWIVEATVPASKGSS
ncbi:MAG: histidine kinase [Actinomycetota bacterium]|nr:sensor histidine kinase [Actinomycetota bacterium]